MFELHKVKLQLRAARLTGEGSVFGLLTRRNYQYENARSLDRSVTSMMSMTYVAKYWIVKFSSIHDENQTFKCWGHTNVAPIAHLQAPSSSSYHKRKTGGRWKWEYFKGKIGTSNGNGKFIPLQIVKRPDAIHSNCRPSSPHTSGPGHGRRRRPAEIPGWVMIRISSWVLSVTWKAGQMLISERHLAAEEHLKFN